MSFPLDQFGQAVQDRRRGRAPVESLNVCEARLSLSSGQLWMLGSVGSSSNIYLVPLDKGGIIKLFDTTFKQWAPRWLGAEKSIVIPATLFRLFDLFAYWDGAAIALEAVSWNQNTYTITGVSIGLNPTITTSAAHGRSVGQLVGIAGVVGTAGTSATHGVNGTVWTVASTPTATTLTLDNADTTGLAYTSDGVLYSIPQTRATLLDTQDGVWVKAGDFSRRYLGTCMTGGTSGASQCVFGLPGTPANWLLWNFYHQRPVELFAGETTDTWPYTVAAHRAVNNRAKLNRLGFVIGLEEHPGVRAVHNFLANNSTPYYSVAGLDLDGFTANDCQIKANVNPVPYSGVSEYKGFPGIGYHYLGMTEYSEVSGVTDWYGDNGTPTLTQTGARVWIWA